MDRTSSVERCWGCGMNVKSGFLLNRGRGVNKYCILCWQRMFSLDCICFKIIDDFEDWTTYDDFEHVALKLHDECGHVDSNKYLSFFTHEGYKRNDVISFQYKKVLFKDSSRTLYHFYDVALKHDCPTSELHRCTCLIISPNPQYLRTYKCHAQIHDCICNKKSSLDYLDLKSWECLFCKNSSKP